MVNLKTTLNKTKFNSQSSTEASIETRDLPSVRNQVLHRSSFPWHIAIYLLLRNITDRLAAFLAIILLSPLLILIALAIRIDSPGNPFFSQERVGLRGRKFTAYKFRTMRARNDDSAYKAYLRQYILQDAPFKITEKGEKIFKLVDDPRITRIGAILRKTNLDELPQFFNIIMGQMAFIGPRPDIPFSVNLYNNWHRQRLQIMPGITGLWQVGRRKGLSFNEMVQIDLEYIQRVSLVLDLKIILLTIRTILVGDGS